MTRSGRETFGMTVVHSHQRSATTKVHSPLIPIWPLAKHSLNSNYRPSYAHRPSRPSHANSHHCDHHPAVVNSTRFAWIPQSIVAIKGATGQPIVSPTRLCDSHQHTLPGHCFPEAGLGVENIRETCGRACGFHSCEKGDRRGRERREISGVGGEGEEDFETSAS